MLAAARTEVALARVVKQLAEDFGLTLADVQQLVDHAVDAYSGAPVRTYIPVLVDRAIRSRLTESRRSAAAASSAIH